ncbi:MAG: FGGY-family carbohydrate kinase [Clostridiales bacterium]|jgi:xylulokinase|nr:FGGY-family carbohydrate kinase [Clostridiales bacterium]
MNYILSHDIGTSSDKAVLVGFNGQIVDTAQENYPTYYPYPAWVEQNPADYWDAVCKTSRRIVEKTGIAPSDIKGIVFSTQAQGIIPIDKDGKTLYNNITWVDGRAEKQAQGIMRKLGGRKLFTLIAGTPIMGKDCIAKIIWLKQERPDIYNYAEYILDVNAFLKFKCTGVKVFERSGASSYGLDLKKKEWLSVMSLTGIDMKKLPPLVNSTDKVGDGLTAEAAAATGLVQGTPVFGGCDDVQSAAVGAGMSGDGDVHIYLGTSAWVAATSKTAAKFMHGAAAIQSANPKMNLIAGITEAAGSNIQWICDQFFRQEKKQLGEGIYAYMDDVIKDIPPGSDHLICTPWMLGERCPVSSTTTRATLFNISPDHTREHLMRAVYEGIAFNLRWILENFKKDYGFSCKNFRIIGGGALDKEWMKIIADVTDTEFDVVENPRNAGALGSAIVALIGLGELPDFESARNFVKIAATYRPDPKNTAIYNELFAIYKRLFENLDGTYKLANTKRFS